MVDSQGQFNPFGRGKEKAGLHNADRPFPEENILVIPSSGECLYFIESIPLDLPH